MAEELKDLIEKIQQEGVKAAQDQARQIEDEARKQADAIIEKAKAQAQNLIAEAEDKISRMEESTKASLDQVGRDIMLSLRKEINAMLDRLIVLQVREALSPEELAKIITLLIKDYHGKDDITIMLKKEDLEKIEKSFLAKLKEETKKGVVLKPSEDILGGFIISYDSGKSHFDFTDKALAEYIGKYLKPKLAQILKDSSS